MGNEVNGRVPETVKPVMYGDTSTKGIIPFIPIPVILAVKAWIKFQVTENRKLEM